MMPKREDEVVNIFLDGMLEQQKRDLFAMIDRDASHVERMFSGSKTGKDFILCAIACVTAWTHADGKSVVFDSTICKAQLNAYLMHRMRLSLQRRAADKFIADFDCVIKDTFTGIDKRVIANYQTAVSQFNDCLKWVYFKDSKIKRLTTTFENMQYLSASLKRMPYYAGESYSQLDINRIEKLAVAMTIHGVDRLVEWTSDKLLSLYE